MEINSEMLTKHIRMQLIRSHFGSSHFGSSHFGSSPKPFRLERLERVSLLLWLPFWLWGSPGFAFTSPPPQCRPRVLPLLPQPSPRSAAGPKKATPPTPRTSPGTSSTASSRPSAPTSPPTSRTRSPTRPLLVSSRS